MTISAEDSPGLTNRAQEGALVWVLLHIISGATATLRHLCQQRAPEGQVRIFDRFSVLKGVSVSIRKVAILGRA